MVTAGEEEREERGGKRGSSVGLVGRTEGADSALLAQSPTRVPASWDLAHTSFLTDNPQVRTELENLHSPLLCFFI